MVVFDAGFFNCANWNGKIYGSNTWASYKLHFIKAQQNYKWQHQEKKKIGGFCGASLVQTEQMEYDEEVLVNMARSEA